MNQQVDVETVGVTPPNAELAYKDLPAIQLPKAKASKAKTSSRTGTR